MMTLPPPPRPNEADIASATALFEQDFADSWWLNDPHYRASCIRSLAQAEMMKRINRDRFPTQKRTAA
jgi:hypothetical protein